jgi:hypothetical protein
MNIFILDKNPYAASMMLCDKHVVKMLLESAQLLCSPFENGSAPYKRTHYNHPCSIWIRQTYANYCWLLDHAYGISDQYLRRYKKIHKSHEVLKWCLDNLESLSFPEIGLQSFVQCMPDQYKVVGDAVQAYRNYYIGEKAKFAKWKLGNTPNWWVSQL